jgi:hypothetical protein
MLCGELFISRRRALRRCRADAFAGDDFGASRACEAFSIRTTVERARNHQPLTGNVAPHQ